MFARLSFVIAVSLVALGCTGSDDPATTTTSTAAGEAVEVTTTQPPIILDVAQALSLVAGQCWGELPTPQPSTSVPSSPVVAVVDCAGSSLGLVYGAGCLGTKPDDTREPVITVACPGNPEDPWPVARNIALVLATTCLPQFEEGVGERYAVSELDAIELFPTEEQWVSGERRYVCTAQQSDSTE